MALQISWKMRFLLILVGGLLLSVASILLPQTANAATTTYNYTKDGKISVKFEDQTYYLTKSPISMGGKDTYNGVVTLSGNSGLGLEIPNLSAPLQGKCALGISVTASPGASSGQVSAPAALNGIPGAGNGGQSYTPSCSKELASKQTEFNRSISIGTTDANSGSNPETEGDREVIVTLYSPVPNPPNVTITQKKPSSDTRTISNWTTSTKSEVWGNVDGGTQFEFCISPVAPFDSQSCKTGTKKTGEPLLISFGSAENAFNADGKKVLVDVNLNIPAAPTSTTYGPLGVTIFSNDKSVQGSTQTESNTFGKEGQPTVAQKFTLKALFDGIDAGTYKVCLTNNTSLCSAEFTKESNKQAKASIDVSEEETKKLAVGEAGPTCAIDGVGWILCPVVNFLAGLADGAFKIISDSFLSTNIGVVDVNGPSYKAWTIMRNLANAAFVIAFLIIIFSQLTGLGVSNYGVKKMLPRLIVAAILVNLSFFICQAAVDLSNVLGYSIQSSISGVGDNIANISTSSDGVSPFADGSGFLGMAGGILAFAAGGVLLYALLSTFIPVILAAVIALVMILLLLVARQALILILIVISPLAFVAYLLPNTEKLFTQWRKILTALLLLFPIIALVFGLSSLASKVLTYTFSGDLGADSNANTWFGQIVGAAVLVLPLFVVPSLLKKSLDSIPMVGQMASKWANKATGRAGSKLKESYQGSLVGRGAAIRKHAKENYRNKKFAERINRGGVMGSMNRVLSSEIPILPSSIAGNKAILKSATATTLKAEQEERSDARAVIEYANLSGAERQTLATTGKVTYKDKRTGQMREIKGEMYQKGAIEIQLKTGSMADISHIVGQSAAGKSLSSYSQLIADHAASNGLGAKDPAFSGKNLDAIAQGTFDFKTARQAAMKEGKVNAEALASMHDDAREEYVRLALDAERQGDASYRAILASAKSGIASTPELSAKVAGNVRANGDLNKI